MTRCPHRRTGLYKIPFVVGERASYHIAQLCLDCGANARGRGVWVPRREVADADRLPVRPRRPKGGAA
jgi:hypothetical protein